MSAALLRKSLELVESSKPRPTGAKRRRVEHDTDELLRRINQQPEEQHQKKRRAVKPSNVKTTPILHGAQAAEAAAKALAISEAERVTSNVQQLLELSSRNEAHPDFVATICARAGKKPIKKQKQRKPTEISAFSEEDFKKFEKTYFGK